MKNECQFADDDDKNDVLGKFLKREREGGRVFEMRVPLIDSYRFFEGNLQQSQHQCSKDDKFSVVQEFF